MTTFICNSWKLLSVILSWNCSSKITNSQNYKSQDYLLNPISFSDLVKQINLSFKFNSLLASMTSLSNPLLCVSFLSLFLVQSPTSFVFKDFIYLFLEREEEKEKERERNINVWLPLAHPLLALNPGMCPDWESDWQLFGSQAGTQSTEPHQPGLNHLHLKCLNVVFPLGSRACFLFLFYNVLLSEISSKYMSCLLYTSDAADEVCRV